MTKLERAYAEFHKYAFRLVWIAHIPVMYVTKKDGTGHYNVNLNKKHCDCADFTNRCEGKGIVCKHILMANLFLHNSPHPMKELPTKPTDTNEQRIARAKRESQTLWG